jgi:hypothetical protein
MADIATPPGPDAELIRLCDRLVANRAREEALYRAIPDENKRAPVLAPITDEWFELADALCEMESPRTPEGARAMALAAMAQVPRKSDDTVLCTELHEVLSIGCVEFILASTCGREPTEKGFGT